MALSQSALSELLGAFRTGEGVNLIQDALQLALQELMLKVGREFAKQHGGDKVG